MLEQKGDSMETRPNVDIPVYGHETNELNHYLSIKADGPGVGGASHNYTITTLPSGDREAEQFRIRFQNGPIQEVGVNGLSNEALLAVVRHRLQGFQSGQYACRENALALTKIEESLHWLMHRTREREQRGVEGTSQK